MNRDEKPKCIVFALGSALFRDVPCPVYALAVLRSYYRGVLPVYFKRYGCVIIVLVYLCYLMVFCNSAMF